MESVIKKKLQEIEEWEKVKIIMAIESGSRVWNFGSPDSKYNVKFLYLRDQKEYFRLDEHKEVIEWNFNDTLVIEGWDFKKALNLLHSSDPSLYEWCFSPIVYRSSDAFEELKKIVPKYFSKKNSLYYYWNTASSNYKKHLRGHKVQIKNYFYALRPLLAAKWIFSHNCPPPMNFSELLDAEFPADLRVEADKLLAMKKISSKMGYALKIVVLNNYIEESLEELKEEIKKISNCHFTWDELNEFFYKTIMSEIKKV